MSKKLIAVLIGTIALTGLSISTLANAAKSTRPTQQLTLSTGKKTEMNTNQINKEEAAKMLAEIKRRFQKAGINLTPEQVPILCGVLSAIFGKRFLDILIGVIFNSP